MSFKKILNNRRFRLNKTEHKTEVLLYADIGSWGLTAEAFKNTVKPLQGEKKTLRVNSYGGEVFDGFAIYNEIHDDSENWEAEIDGVAASISSVIPLGASVVRAHSNSMFMIHNPWVIIAGDAKALEKEAELLNKMKNNIIDIYAARMKDWSREDIAEMMDVETWLTAKEALDAGLIDEIIDPIEVEEPETDKGKRVPVSYAKKAFVNFKQVTNKGEDSMNKCPHCGKEHTDKDAKYCIACGKIMDSAAALKAAAELERKEAVAAERARIANIAALAKKMNLSDEKVTEYINSGEAYDKIAVKAIEEMNVEPPVNRGSNHSDVTPKLDSSDKFVEHVVNCVQVAARLEKDPERIKDSRKDVFLGNSIHSVMRVDLERNGISSAHMTPEQMYTKCIQMFGTGSSDLPLIMEAASNKSLLRGYEGAPTTYQIWTSRREVPDFKTQKLLSMSNFGDLKDLPEGGDFEDAKLAENRETYSIDTKGRKFTISRQAIINDDMDVFTRVPAMMGRAAGKRINRDVYDVLTYNSLVGPTMSDAVALFNLASHYNLIATSGLVSDTTLAASERKLLEMPLLKPEPDAPTDYANLTGRYLLAGTGQKNTILKVLKSGMDISQSIAGVNTEYNYMNTIPVFDPYLQSKLTGDDANGWYHVADQMDAETIGVAFLSGNTSPTMRRAESAVGMALGMALDIFFDWGVYVADYRGIIRNDGKVS